MFIAHDKNERPEDMFSFSAERSLRDVSVGPGAWTVAPLQSIASQLAAACSLAIVQQRCIEAGVTPIPLEKEYLVLAGEALDYLQMADEGKAVSIRLREPDPARSVTLDDKTTRAIDAYAEVASLERAKGGLDREKLVAALQSLTNGRKDLDALQYGRDAFTQLGLQFRSLLSASRPELGE